MSRAGDRAWIGTLLLTVPIASDWIAGALPEDEVGEDYLVRPVVDGSARAVLGWLATIVVVGTLIRLWPWLRSSSWNLRQAVAYAVVAGVVIGVGYRIVTSPVAGANIGGGMAIMFGTPLCAALLVGSIVTARWADD